MHRRREESIGQRVKLLRRRKVLTQAELSSISGVPLPTIKDIERGATETPRVKTMRLLAEAFGVSASYLMNGDSPID